MIDLTKKYKTRSGLIPLSIVHTPSNAVCAQLTAFFDLDNGGSLAVNLFENGKYYSDPSLNHRYDLIEVKEIDYLNMSATQKAEVMIAFDAGKPIEYIHKSTFRINSTPEWEKVAYIPYWDWLNIIYRVAKPKPLTVEEIAHNYADKIQKRGCLGFEVNPTIFDAYMEGYKAAKPVGGE